MIEADTSGAGGYAVLAQYYDLIFPADQRDAVRAGLGKLLDGSGRVLEIGSGTGIFTETLLECLAEDGEVFAVEPSPTMRAALVTRLAALGEPRVTVLPDDALTAEVDGPLDAVVLLHVLTHFSPTDRRTLWQRWVPRVPHGGIIIVDAQQPQEPVAVPPSVIPGRTLGQRRYDTVAEAAVAADRLLWTMTYRVHEGDRLISEERVSYPSFVASDGTLHAELGEAGCTPVADVAAGLLAWRKD